MNHWTLLAFYSSNILIIENRIYREEFTRKKCKTAILLYCFHTVGVLHIFMLYNLLGLEYHLIENLKLLLKENQIMKKAGFIIDQWSFHIDCMPFTLQTMIFRYNYKSNDVFIHLIHYKVYLTVYKIRNWNG